MRCPYCKGRCELKNKVWNPNKGLKGGFETQLETCHHCGGSGQIK